MLTCGDFGSSGAAAKEVCTNGCAIFDSVDSAVGTVSTVKVAASVCAERPLPKALRPAGIAFDTRYNQSYTKPMKTAISIPDSLFEEAERLAKVRGWSRSELYANAVTAYVNSERFAGVREKLDSVYGLNQEDSAIDPLLADAQVRSLSKEKW